MNPSYEDALADFRKLKGRAKKGLYKLVYSEWLEHLADMSKGGDAGGLRHVHYDGWEDEHFAQLLGDLTNGTTT